MAPRPPPSPPPPAPPLPPLTPGLVIRWAVESTMGIGLEYIDFSVPDWMREWENVFTPWVVEADHTIDAEAEKGPDAADRRRLQEGESPGEIAETQKIVRGATIVKTTFTTLSKAEYKRILDFLMFYKERNDLEGLSKLLGFPIAWIGPVSGSFLQVEDPHTTDDDDDDELLYLLFLLLLLIPIIWLMYVCIRYRGQERTYFKWRFSHSNPYVMWLYVPKERRDELWAELSGGPVEDRDKSDMSVGGVETAGVSERSGGKSPSKSDVGSEVSEKTYHE